MKKIFQKFVIPRVLPAALFLYLALFSAGCLGPVQKLYPENEQRRSIHGYVVSHGWHTSLAFKAEHLRDKLPKHPQLPNSDYWAFSWGDNKYFPSERARLDLFLRAAFLPTGSVIHLVGFDQNIDRFFKNSDIVRIQISKKGMGKISDCLEEQFTLDSDGNLKFTADGLYTNSAFFEANGLYFFPKTSNKWTARLLRKSGFPITPFYAITSGNVIYQARKEGKIIQRR